MKNKVLFLLMIFLLPSFVNARTYKVKLDKCVDGDTAKFIIKGEKKTFRFLAIDAPEVYHNGEISEPFAEDAKLFVCNELKNAKKIEIEYDKNSNKTDKYDRHLVWVFVDGELLQDLIIQNGYAKVHYLYGDYKYTEILQDSESHAK